MASAVKHCRQEYMVMSSKFCVCGLSEIHRRSHGVTALSAAGILRDPPDLSIAAFMEETCPILFQCAGDALKAADIHPREVKRQWHANLSAILLALPVSLVICIHATQRGEPSP